MEHRPRVIATVINDVVYDQRMIRICSSLASVYDVQLWGRKKSNAQMVDRLFTQKRFSFLINKGPLFYLLYNVKVFFKLLFTPFDIVHSVDLDTLPAGYFASKIKGKKLIYDSHEYFTEVPELVSRPTKRRMWLAIEQRILPNVKNAMTVGAKIAEEYTKKYGVSFGVVRNCPKLSKQDPVRNPKDKFALYQGALNKGRGLEVLILAMKHTSINLKLAGSGDLDDELKTLVEEHKLTEKIEFLGMLGPAELSLLTAQAFVGINVSENLGLSYYYSLNNKFFDYINAGLPAITNPFPEYQALNDAYDCVCFATAESEDIARAINLLLDDEPYYRKLRKNCLLARQELNWEEEEKALLEIYNQIV